MTALHLRNAPVRQDLDALGASLTRVIGAVRLTVIEHIPLIADLLDAAVICARVVESVFLSPAAIADIAVGNDDAAIDKISVGEFARRVAELVVVHGRVDKIIGVPDLANR